MYNTLGKQMGGWLRWVCFIKHKFFHVDFHLALDNLLNISEYVQLAKKNLGCSSLCSHRSQENVVHQKIAL